MLRPGNLGNWTFNGNSFVTHRFNGLSDEASTTNAKSNFILGISTRMVLITLMLVMAVGPFCGMMVFDAATGKKTKKRKR